MRSVRHAWMKTICTTERNENGFNTLKNVHDDWTSRQNTVKCTFIHSRKSLTRVWNEICFESCRLESRVRSSIASLAHIAFSNIVREFSPPRSCVEIFHAREKKTVDLSGRKKRNVCLLTARFSEREKSIFENFPQTRRDVVWPVLTSVISGRRSKTTNPIPSRTRRFDF